MDLNGRLLEQLTFHWEHQARPRLDGLTDEEYLWEPAPGAWSLRLRAEARTSMAAGTGDLVLDFEHPEPDPAPITTIAWRLGHVTVAVLGMRNANHFGHAPMDHQSTRWAPDAKGALAALDEEYERWVSGVRSLGETRLAEPVGQAEGPYAEWPYLGLVLHIHREVIHHLAEVALLRDLWVDRPGQATGR